MFHRRRHFLSILAALAILCAVPLASADAASLNELHASGAVGERFDGYAVARDSSAASFVNQVNAERRKIYQKAAAEQNADVGEVGKVYAQQIMRKAPKGTWFLQANNKWSQK